MTSPISSPKPSSMSSIGRKVHQPRPFDQGRYQPDLPLPLSQPRRLSATSVPGAGRYRFVGTRDTDGTYAMIYAPIGRPVTVQMETIKGANVKARRFNPRDGSATAIGTFANQGEREFIPPDKGEMLDWVLVLDDAAQNYPAPGTRR